MDARLYCSEVNWGKLLVFKSEVCSIILSLARGITDLETCVCVAPSFKIQKNRNARLHMMSLINEYR